MFLAFQKLGMQKTEVEPRGTSDRGSFVVTLLRSDVGNPPNGAHLTNTWADVHGSLTAQGRGEYYTAAADRGPDFNYGSDYVVGQTC